MEEKISKTERISGGLIGLLVGDALGVPYEFHDRESIPPFEKIEIEPPEGFHRSHLEAPPGTWSDDGAQALCLLASLLKCEKFDPEDFSQRLIKWYREDYLAVDEVFDVGNQTLRAILNLRKGIPPLEAGPNEESRNGNGSLMRVLPLAIWHEGSDEDLIKDSFSQSRITHGHLRSQICCSIYCLWARNILKEIQNPWQNALRTFRNIFPENTPEFEELSTKILPENGPHEIKGGGYVVDSLRATLWLISNHTNYEQVVKSAVLLGDDTDTTACIAGGIAGLKYGVNSIPPHWIEKLRGKDLYFPFLEKLIELRK